MPFFLPADITTGWNALYLENHDLARSLSRFADDRAEWRTISGKMLATWIGSLRGTLFLYQGQEIGMTNIRDWPIEKFRDIQTLNFYNSLSLL